MLFAVGAITLVWLAGAWGIASVLTARRARAALAEGQERLRQHLAGTAAGVANNLRLLHEIPAALGRATEIHQALKRIPRSQAEERGHWATDAGLMRVDQLLERSTADIKALSVIWVMNPQGDCIAASNYRTGESFVGTNYEDRGYFCEAMTDRFSQQFAVGRNTGIPGLFFSAPVEEDGKVLGVIAGKINLPVLNDCISQTEAFLTDPYGVVILARSKDLEFRTWPGARVWGVSAFERMARYRKNTFERLSIQPWDDARYPQLTRFNGSETPVLLATEAVPKDDLSVTVIERMPGIVVLGRDRLWLYALLALLGTAVLGCGAATFTYIRQITLARKALGAKLVELALAKAAADAANIAKSQFLATMSHEIRTPLNGVLGMAELLLPDQLDNIERQDYARTILNSGNTLLTLINDILDLSKVEAGKMELSLSVFGPEQVLKEIAALFAEMATRKDLRLEAQWGGPAGQAYLGDPVRVRQMLSNLANNAIKFTDSGTIRIEATELERDGDHALLQFSVIDSGIGISDDQCALLFQPFSQLDSSATRPYAGTGLGLSIVASLARLMGGDVGVASVKGSGSRFWFRIRCGLSATPAASAAWAHGPDPAGGAAQVPPDQRRILVVEDNPTNRKVIQALLDKRGYRVSCVENGLQALEAVTREAPPDLILMDCQMPVMSGFEATRQIRQWESENGRNRLPIVALTASAFQEDKDHCLEAGMDDFVTKPIDFVALPAVIARRIRQE